jgi:uncharacterized protein GlcG (DUF336 family)
MTATFERTSVSLELAKAMIDASERKAAELGQPVGIAVVDDSGVLKAFSRMDGSTLMSVQIAQDKAYSAVGFRISTDAWHEMSRDDPAMVSGIDRVVAVGGGFPITIGDNIVGGIGVSGASNIGQNQEVAKAGLAAAT